MSNWIYIPMKLFNWFTFTHAFESFSRKFFVLPAAKVVHTFFHSLFHCSTLDRFIYFTMPYLRHIASLSRFFSLFYYIWVTSRMTHNELRHCWTSLLENNLVIIDLLDRTKFLPVSIRNNLFFFRDFIVWVLCWSTCY